MFLRRNIQSVRARGSTLKKKQHFSNKGVRGGVFYFYFFLLNFFKSKGIQISISSSEPFSGGVLGADVESVVLEQVTVHSLHKCLSGSTLMMHLPPLIWTSLIELVSRLLEFFCLALILRICRVHRATLAISGTLIVPLLNSAGQPLFCNRFVRLCSPFSDLIIEKGAV